MHHALFNNLRILRQAGGLTQSDVAEAVGLKSAYAVSRWERGLALPTMDRVFKLAILFDVSLNGLYPIVHWPERIIE